MMCSVEYLRVLPSGNHSYHSLIFCLSFLGTMTLLIL